MGFGSRSIGGVLACALAVLSGGNPVSAEPQLRDGDLVFQESGGGQSAAVLAATGSRLTHMGIIRLRGATPVVVEAIGPVLETPFADWIARGVGGRYALYRVQGLEPKEAAHMLQAAERYYGLPYDILFRPDTDAIYCSELAHLAFAAIGIELGRAEPLGDLNLSAASVTALIAARWQRHPDCRAAGSAEACLGIIRTQMVVTPASIAEDADLTLIRSDF